MTTNVKKASNRKTVQASKTARKNAGKKAQMRHQAEHDGAATMAVVKGGKRGKAGKVPPHNCQVKVFKQPNGKLARSIKAHMPEPKDLKPLHEWFKYVPDYKTPFDDDAPEWVQLPQLDFWQFRTLQSSLIKWHEENPAKTKLAKRKGQEFMTWLRSAPKMCASDELMTIEMPVRLHADYWLNLERIAQQNDWSLEEAVYELLADAVENYDCRKERQERLLSAIPGTAKP